MSNGVIQQKAGPGMDVPIAATDGEYTANPHHQEDLPSPADADDGAYDEDEDEDLVQDEEDIEQDDVASGASAAGDVPSNEAAAVTAAAAPLPGPTSALTLFLMDKSRLFNKDYNLHEVRFSTKERLMESVVEAPASEVLSDEQFWLEEGRPNCEVIKEHLRREGRVSLQQLNTLIDEVYQIFCSEENVLEVDAPITLCGDVHGQYYDLLKLLEVGGDPACTNYLFLGDYVDRGLFSMECLILLFCYKMSYPCNFFMLRGNHECRHLTEYFTFKQECEYKYGKEVYASLMDCFDALPLAGIMNKQFLCVHGGLSPDIEMVDDIRTIERFCEPPPSGAMCDLLWADPMEPFDEEVESLYEFNTVRGCSFNFSFNSVCDFLEKNGLLSVIRAHEAQDAGYKMHRRNERTGFPSLITIFSAPNYLDSYNNKGALMRYENNVINIRQFNCSPHPYNLPGFMNVFNWSLPFVAEKVVELLNVLKKLVDDEEAEKQELASRDLDFKRDALRSKVRSAARMLRLYKAMSSRSEKEKLTQNLSPEKNTDSPLSQSVNEARPPGVNQIVEASKSEPRTPEALRRRHSREKILIQRNHQRTGSRGGIKVLELRGGVVVSTQPHSSSHQQHSHQQVTEDVAASDSPSRTAKLTTSNSEGAVVVVVEEGGVPLITTSDTNESPGVVLGESTTTITSQQK